MNSTSPTRLIDPHDEQDTAKMPREGDGPEPSAGDGASPGCSGDRVCEKRARLPAGLG